MNEETLVNFTWYESAYPITKKYYLNEEEIESSSKMKLNEATASYQTILFQDFPEKLKEATKNNALTSGVFSKNEYGEKVTCLSDAKWRKDKECKKKIIRNKDFINHDNNNGNGLVILDIDQPPVGDIIKPDELYMLLCEVIPTFRNILCFSIGSSSTRVHGFNKEGYRLYFPSSTPTQIPEFIKRLFDHLILKGFGFVAFTSRGGLIIKTLIDKSMQSAVQLDVCGDVDVGLGVIKKELKSKWLNQCGIALDCSVLNDLSKEELNQLTKIKTKLKNEDTVKNKQKWIINNEKESRMAEYLKETGERTNINNFFDLNYEASQLKDGRIFMKDKLDCMCLLEFENGDKKTVADVLKNPSEYNKHQLADPVEGPNYPSGLQCAIFYSDNKGTGPCIFSFAHGGILYELLHPVIPAPEITNVLSLEDATEKLNKEVNSFFSPDKSSADNHRHKVIAATPGLGKTYAIFAAVNELKKSNNGYLRVHLYIPTHKLADELVTSMERKFPDLVIKTQKGRGTDGYCDRYNEIQAFEGLISSVRTLFCDDKKGKTCQYISSCKYMAQFTQDFDVLILAHQYLNIPYPEKIEKPSYVVIDESYSNTVLSHEEIHFSSLVDIIGSEYVKALGCVVGQSPESSDGFHRLLAAELDKESLDYQSMMEDVGNFIKINKESDNVNIDGTTNSNYRDYRIISKLKKQKRQFKAAYALNKLGQFKNGAFYYFFSCIGDIDVKFYAMNRLPSGFILPDRYSADPNRYDDFSGYQLTEKKKRSRYMDFLYSVPILVIDGNASPEVSNALLGTPDLDVFRKPEFIRINVERKLCVTQCNSRTFSQRSLLKDNNAKKLRQDVADLIKRTVASNWNVYKEETLLVTYKKLKDHAHFTSLLTNVEHLEILHFNALRGIDKFSKCHVIILGRNEPSPSDVLLRTENLFKYLIMDPDFTKEMSSLDNSLLKIENDLRKKKNDLRKKINDLWKKKNDLWENKVHSLIHKTDLFDDGFKVIRHAAFKVKTGAKQEKGRVRYFEGKNPNIVLKTIRESESLQAIARIRDIRASEHRQVLILSSLVLDLEIDRVMSWSELNVKKQKKDIMRFYEKHDGRFIKSPTLLAALEPSISRNQWKERLKVGMERYTLPMGEIDIKTCQALSAKGGNNIDFEEHLSSKGFKEISIKIPRKRNEYKVVYDPKRHTVDEIRVWAEGLMIETGKVSKG